MIFLNIFLWPFSFLYLLVTTIRNGFYDLGWCKRYTLPVAVVCIGNLKAGGTGKTPLTLFILQHVAHRYKTAVLSRGYGRTTKGFILASEQDTAQTIGDEPLQCYRHADGVYQVAVCEDRVEGVTQLLKHFPETELILLDDGFQHRRLNRDLDIVLTEYGDPFFRDWLLPLGRLREARSGAARAGAVVVTKCPVTVNKDFFASNISAYTKAPVYYSSILYGSLKNAHTERSLAPQDEVVLLSGIANPLPLYQYLKEQAVVVHHAVYKDHYRYTTEDLAQAEEIRAAHTHGIVVVTEKDWVKILPYITQQLDLYRNWYYLPVAIDLNEHHTFITQVDTTINQRLSALKNK